MLRLGLRLALRGGREALIRLLVTTVAVAVGVAVLLCVLADFHAFQVSNNRPCWECTVAAAKSAPRASEALWNSSADFYEGQTIERLDVAALGPNAPVPPGITRLPGPGQYDASPALAALLRTVPRDQLGARFPGRLAGTIGDKALSGPDELVVFVGYSPSRLAALPATIRVDRIASAPGKQVWSAYFRYAFAVGVLAVLFPVLILISTATRLSAARREERFAAMRLVGATPVQVGVVASIDAIVSALLGVLLGIGVFALVQPALAGAALIGTRYFAYDVTPTAAGYAGMLVAVPLASALASVLSLRRLQISPLGVTRKVTPPPPTFWRVVPLLAGIAAFVAGLAITNSQGIGAPTYPGLLIIMIGLVVGGPWLTAQAARLFGRLTRGAASMLAARRLADNPKTAFRTVSGLVLAVFLGTIVAGLVPAVNATTATPSASALTNVLSDAFGSGQSLSPAAVGAGAASGGGIAPKAGARLVSELRTFRGATVVPVYALPLPAVLRRQPGRHGRPGLRGAASGDVVPSGPQAGQPYDSIVTCASLRQLSVLGRCAPGVAAVKVSAGNLLYDDNPTYSTQAIARASSPAVSGSLDRYYLEAVLVKVNNPTTLELVRTFLDTHTTQAVSSVPPKTFGEAVQIRIAYATIVQRLVYIAVALTLIVAGCSLAVVVGGGMVERKRPFTLLRVTGTSLATLYRVVLLEAILPLVSAAVVAAGIAYGISVLTVDRMAPAGTPTPGLGHVYYLTLGAGLAASLLVIVLTLPVLGRITGPRSVRFE
ncbi:MAG TPA: FtsX-like permease family protein [Streptosporangiaceae bacterium]|nr:FtsX-like permease family protein [Streptosporangiaceae bacterium]